MSSPHFIVRVPDLEQGPKDVTWEISQEYFDAAFADTDASFIAPGEAELEFQKNGRQVMVRGTARLSVHLPCVWSLEPVRVDLAPEIFLMLSPQAAADPVPGERKHRKDHLPGVGPSPHKRKPKHERAGSGASAGATADKTKGRAGKGQPGGGASGTTKAAASSKGARSWEQDPELGDSDAASDFYQGDEISFDGFLREFLLLEFPMRVVKEGLHDPGEGASTASPAGSRPLAPAAPAGADPDASGAADTDSQESIDPRLAPLAELAKRLRDKKE